MLSTLPGTAQGAAVPALLALAVLTLPAAPGRSRWRALTGTGAGLPTARLLAPPLPLLAAPLGWLLLGPAGAVCAAELVAVPNQHRVERAIKMEPDPGPPNDAPAAIEQDWLDGTALNALGLFSR